MWKRNLTVLVGAQLLSVSAMGIIIPLIPFFVRELGVGDRAAVERWSGLIFSGPFLGAALMSPLWGWLGDKYGHKLVVVRAIAGLAVSNFLFTLLETPDQFYALRLAQGLVTGFIPAALAITSATTPSDRLPEAMGKLHASASAGRLIGPAIGGLLAGFLAYRQIFILTGTIISLGAVLVLVFLADPPAPAQPRKSSAAANMRYVIGDWRVRTGLLGLLVAMSAVSMVMPIFPLYVEDLVGAVDASFWTGIGFAIVAAATLVTSSLMGRIAGVIGLKVVLLSALGITALSLALHPIVTGIITMLAVRALLGIGVAGIAPILHTMISRLAPEGMRGGVTGYASSATILGFFVGPMCGGHIANQVGVGGVFRVSSGVVLACGLGAALLARRAGAQREIQTAVRETPR